jgi:hypothetical protein
MLRAMRKIAVRDMVPVFSDQGLVGFYPQITQITLIFGYRLYEIYGLALLIRASRIAKKLVRFPLPKGEVFEDGASQEFARDRVFGDQVDIDRQEPLQKSQQAFGLNLFGDAVRHLA